MPDDRRQPYDAFEGDELSYLRAAAAELERRETAKAEALAQRDAERRANHWGTPPFLTTFTNAVVPGHQRVDELDAASAEMETALNRAITGFDDYSPEQARSAVAKAVAERDARYRQEHPYRAYAAEVLAGATQDAIGARFGIPAGATTPVLGALKGADRAEPGHEVGGGVSGAVGAMLVDGFADRITKSLPLPKGTKAAVENAIEVGVETFIDDRVKPWFEDFKEGLAVPKPPRNAPYRKPPPATNARGRPITSSPHVPRFPSMRQPPPAQNTTALPAPAPATRPVPAPMAGLAQSIARPAFPLAAAVYDRFIGPSTPAARRGTSR